MQKLFIICFLLMNFLPVKSQNKASTDKSTFQGEVLGRFNFLGLLDGFDQNISVGAEYQFHPKWSAGLDAGYIFQSEYIEEHTSVGGVILRPFIRYYFKEKRNGFLEAHLHYKGVAYKVTDWIGRDVINGVPAYEELSAFNFNKKVYGFSVIIGKKFKLIKKNNHVKMEPYFGLGARFKRQAPENGSYSPDSFWVPRIFDPKYDYAAILGGMRVTFKL